MRNIIMSLVLLSLCCILKENALGQESDLRGTMQLIQSRLDMLFQSRYELGFVLSVDSAKKETANVDRAIEDPYGTLDHCIIFAAKGKKIGFSRAPGLLGIFKGSEILWKSDTAIRADMVFDNDIVTTQDINRDGLVDIVTSWIEPQSTIANEQWWIVSWNGGTGRFVNKNENGVSSLRSFEGGFQLVDLNGDGIKEIVAEWIDYPNSEDTVKTTYSWNGELYGKWSNPPQPNPDVGIPRDRVLVIIRSSVTHYPNSNKFSYIVENAPESLQQLDNIRITLRTSSAFEVTSRPKWESFFKKGNFLDWSNLSVNTNLIKQGEKDSSFSFSSTGLPSIQRCSFRGYNGGNSTTNQAKNSFLVLSISAADPPFPFIEHVFLDTLLSYTRESAELGWLGRDRDNDCDNDEKPEDGIVRNIEQRFKKAKRQLERGDSVLARRELEKLVAKVERLWKRSENDEERKHGKDRKNWWRRDKDDRIVMTSEAYALLKYNIEYLIDRLPYQKPKKGAKDKD